MQDYLNDTEHATRELFKILIAEKEKLAELKGELSNLKKHFEFLREDFNTYEEYEDYDNLKLMDRFHKMARKKDEVEQVKRDISSLETTISNNQVSYQAIGMSILQIAKQGISKVHGNPNNCPAGRSIAGENLKNIIWQARNQSIHHEEGNYNRNVESCFNSLKVGFGDGFDLNQHANSNLSVIVIEEVLEWNTFDDYYQDMITLQ